jgi:hypothetical protein
MPCWMAAFISGLLIESQRPVSTRHLHKDRMRSQVSVIVAGLSLASFVCAAPSLESRATSGS